mgnify:CR=1 FL=1
MPKNKTSNVKTVPKKSTKKVEKVEKSPPKEIVETVPVVETESQTPYLEEFSSVLTELDSAMSTIKNLRSRIAKLEKRVHKDHKVMIKKTTGKRRRTPNPDAPPSGFAKPGPVSDDLRKFLSLGKNELIARTDVTKRINAYCKEHGLQGENDKRKINPDASLRKLLNIPKDGELTFFNLQKYMKVHFPNKEGVYPTL